MLEMRSRNVEPMPMPTPILRPTKRVLGLALRTISTLCILATLAGVANAAELVMYRRDGCPWCAKWDREIGPIYPKTDFSKRAPLRLINLDHDRDLPIKHGAIRYTPTFVLVENAKEVGRIEGYPGEDFFWPRLSNLLEALTQPGTPAVPAPGPAAVPPGASELPR
jgi:hypothetical protein